MAIPRNQRRRLAREKHGMSLGEFKRARAENMRQQQEALTLTPAQAREKLAKWCSQPGRTQAEIDSLNFSLGDMQKSHGESDD